MDFFDLSDLENFYAQHPDSIIFAFLAAQYLDTGQPERALEVAEKGVQKHPTYGFGHYILGQSYYHNQNLSKAKTHLELALAYDDKNPGACQLLGEINEKLDLPLMARDSYLQYFVLNSFDPDAVHKFQQTEMNAFHEFDQIPMDQDATVSGTGPTPVDGEGEDTDLLIDDFFDAEPDREEDIDISQKVDEVFKETLGDISMETDLTDRNTGDFEHIDDTFDNLELIETEELPDTPAAETAPPEVHRPAEPESSGAPAENADEFDEALEKAFSGSAAGADTESDFPPVSEEETAATFAEEETPEETEENEDIDLELDELFAEYENEDLGGEDEESPPADEIEFGNLLFDDRLAPEAGEDDTTQGEDILDYSSLVDEMMKETPENNAPPPDVDRESGSDLGASLDIEPPRQPESTFPEPPGRGKAGRPPILSPTLGEIYISQGRFEEAKEVFKQLLEKDPGNARFQKKIADIEAMIAKQRP